MDENKKVAVVTGGGSGIGAGICRRIAKEGATVIIADINTDGAQINAAEIISSGGKADTMYMDVSNKESIGYAIADIKKKYGRIDYFVNDAGISIITPFFKHTEEIWDKTMDINLKAQFLTCQAVIPIMLENGGGTIVNMSSQSGKVGTDDYQAYCSSKFAVIGLTQSLAKEFGKHNIRVNCVCPGVVRTPMWDKQEAGYAAKKGIKPEEVMGYFASKIPMKRIGRVEEVASVVWFLLSDESSYMTGQALNVNGGDIMF